MTIIGKAISINGTIEAEEPVTIAGTVIGDVLASNHDVTLDNGGRIEGAVTGRVITVRGRSTGRLIARELVRVHQTARVKADIAAPKISLEEGALFNGSVEPSRVDAALRVVAYRRKTESPIVA